MTTPRIVIIGGGLGGLTLARILQTRGISATVYERETALQSRDQGGTLDLHVESGQFALREAQLFDQFQSLARPEGQDMRLLDKNGVVYIDEISTDADMMRPEVDRGALRALLLNSLHPDTVVWDHSMRSITALADGCSQLVFDNGVTVTADLVIGADGAWSRVRPLLSDAVPAYTGVSFIEIGLADVDRAQPDIARFVGRGSMFALSDSKGIIAQRNANNYIRVYLALRVPPAWITDSGIPFDQPAIARIRLLDYFADWTTSLTDLIRFCDDRFIPRPIYMLPVDHTWRSRPGLTLLGDAAHLMSPFAGEGANLAMRDAADLAIALSTMPDPAQAIASYEAILFPRAQHAAAESAANLDESIAADAPQGMLAQLVRYGATTE